jgi:hypothetical protein
MMCPVNALMHRQRIGDDCKCNVTEGIRFRRMAIRFDVSTNLLITFARWNDLDGTLFGAEFPADRGSRCDARGE